MYLYAKIQIQEIQKGGNFMQHFSAHVRRLRFYQVLTAWLVFYIVCALLNACTLRSPLATQLVWASLGIFLLFVPVYPRRLALWYEEHICRRIIRIAAVLEIIASFLIAGT